MNRLSKSQFYRCCLVGKYTDLLFYNGGENNFNLISKIKPLSLPLQRWQND